MYVTLLGIISCKNPNKVVGQEQHNGDNHWQPQTTLTNDSPQWSPNKKEDDTGKGQGKLFMQA